MKYRAVASGLSLAFVGLLHAQNSTGTVTVHVDQPGHPIPTDFYGLMTEEINHAYDGGLYAELIQNRSFRDSTEEPKSWAVTGGKLTLEQGPTPDVKVETQGSSVELRNSGYWGIPVKPNTTYRATIRAKVSADFTGPILLSIQSQTGETLASALISKLSKDWNTYEITMRTRNIAPSQTNQFVISHPGPGSFWVNYASLFPPAFHGRKNGLRPDLMTLMHEMRPSFLRLPGGNYLEGDTVGTRFNWKATIGAPIDRLGHQGPWGYRSTDGLGLLEFLKWCEDLKMKPLLAVYAGYSLHGEHVEPGPLLAPFVQDALDEIEYLTGDVSTKWGSQRAKDGHQKAFDLKYVEIGNEDWFDRSRTYSGRYAQFADAIKAKYPKLKLIATAPTTGRIPDVIDDHYYRSAVDMARDAGHYDAYSKTAPKVFVGEWASTEGSPTPTLKAALGDAAWLTGLERDSDVVAMEAYAPLLVNVNKGASQWGTNLIGYDGLTAFGSPSFYVQSMFADYTGARVLPSEVSINLAPSKPKVSRGAIGLGTWATDAEFKDIEVTRGDQTLFKQDFSRGSVGWTADRGKWVQDGDAFRQSSDETDTLAFAGNANWSDYTYHLKAKKLGGSEGFFVPFHVLDDHNYVTWNVGGWGNTRSAIQITTEGSRQDLGRAKRGGMETGRWYDLRIEVAGGHIRCYLDGQLTNEADELPQGLTNPVFVAAGTDHNGAPILKIVNFSDEDIDLKVDLQSSRNVGGVYKGLELKGKPGDVNTVANPQLVGPNPVTITSQGNTFNHVFPKYSVTVLKRTGAG